MQRSARALRSHARFAFRSLHSPVAACVFCQHSQLINSGLRQSIKPVISFRRTVTTSSASTAAPSEDPTLFTRQTPDITNHYTIFPKTLPNGLPPATPFELSLPDLRREFLALQGLIHPDKFPSGVAKQQAEALSARINDAYRTLSDPLSRAQYLLALQHGIDVTSETGAQTHPQDPETLMQVLEVQEAIEEAEDEATILELKKENEERIDETVRVLGEAINRGDVDEAVVECVRLRFWYTIRDVLREWEPGHREVRLIH